MGIRWNPANSTYFAEISGMPPRLPQKWAELFGFLGAQVGPSGSPLEPRQLDLFCGNLGETPANQVELLGFWVGLLAGSGRRETH